MEAQRLRSLPKVTQLVWDLSLVWLWCPRALNHWESALESWLQIQPIPPPEQRAASLHPSLWRLGAA